MYIYNVENLYYTNALICSHLFIHISLYFKHIFISILYKYVTFKSKYYNICCPALNGQSYHC